MQIGSGSIRGAKARNEDTILVFESPRSDRFVVAGGVFDGHGGLFGQFASQTAKETALLSLQRDWESFFAFDSEEWANWASILFAQMHEEIRKAFLHSLSEGNWIDEQGVVRRCNGFPIHGGTTASLCIVLKENTNQRTIISMNCGDSDILMSDNDSGECIRLSMDHGPDNEMEFSRVQGIDSPLKLHFIYDMANRAKHDCPQVFLEDGTKDSRYVDDPWGMHLRPTNVRMDPAVYAISPREVSTDVTCIAMTRALGDFYAHPMGLTHEPSLKIVNLPSDKTVLIVVASDGVWDCWKFPDFVERLAEKTQDIQAAVDTLLDLTVQKANRIFGSANRDDSSLVVIYSSF